jgi:hypothetical protein
VSSWQLESDPSFPHFTFSGFGRYALLEIIGPETSSVRLELDFTTSPLGASADALGLPPAAVVGSQRVDFPVLGSGSARVYSPPVRPRTIDGHQYLVIDMGRPGQLPPVPRHGLGGLWGKNIILDPRYLTSYVRDISLVSSADYTHLTPPTAIRNIPADLANPNLEYSGVYEDGWVGATSYALLRCPSRCRVEVRAEVLVPHQQLMIEVDGRRVLARGVPPGEVNVQSSALFAKGDHRVVLHWAHVAQLSAADRRRVAARLAYVGFDSSP